MDYWEISEEREERWRGFNTSRVRLLIPFPEDRVRTSIYSPFTCQSASPAPLTTLPALLRVAPNPGSRLMVSFQYWPLKLPTDLQLKPELPITPPVLVCERAFTFVMAWLILTTDISREQNVLLGELFGFASWDWGIMRS
ncbi:predicted protein [Histoplasma capsulatum var. duboisii H88]|uniref:Predicted protein n=1 Tax=Ajellomyces capsulatus (strain H88) TaxID=544711 RepID=F0UKS6_AJEC8|nr:predicted protein [Histoplasma capsulatum var. duboisii H88]QSS56658.1 hypothetical protein I7I53_04935 [Histoplasma capsulatum var. duboisii H88]